MSQTKALRSLRSLGWRCCLRDPFHAAGLAQSEAVAIRTAAFASSLIEYALRYDRRNLPGVCAFDPARRDRCKFIIIRFARGHGCIRILCR